MLGYNVCAAETEEQARYLRSSSLQAVLRLRKGMPGELPPPVKNFDESLTPVDRELVAGFGVCSAVGTRATVTAGLAAFIQQTGADELMIASQIYDHQARLRSYEILAEAHRELADQHEDSQPEPASRGRETDSGHPDVHR
jgi:alkanesulfonate monooxygenase SsuD/methylene tetrahydromethanopterin reductase-like flavin-dependent oxidoreductase (luciferase family)